ncbi:hypothetical protein [Streptomyces sp. NPDC020917]|uniref:hypothetical protein n=1 Tax=Streptomyces sp. NPDC020917 TaxID=3365102 RepID=UPI0037A6A325
MTGLASRKITTAALLAGSLALGVLAPTAAGALAPGQDHGTTASTAASAPVTGGTSGPSATKPGAAKPATKPGAAKPGAAKPGSTTAAIASYVNGKVVSSVALRIRSRAATDSTAPGSYAPGAVVKLACKVHGQNVGGNDLWYNLYDRPGWLAARYVRNLGAVPFC